MLGLICQALVARACGSGKLGNHNQLQHEQPCCIGYTVQTGLSRRREWLVKRRLDENIRILGQFKIYK